MHAPQEAKPDSPNPPTQALIAKCFKYLLGDKIVVAIKNCADWLFCLDEFRHGKQLDNERKQLENDHQSIENEARYLKLLEEKIATINRTIQSLDELTSKEPLPEEEKQRLRVRYIQPLRYAQAEILVEIVARQRNILPAPVVIYSRGPNPAAALQSIHTMPFSTDGHQPLAPPTGPHNNHDSQMFSEPTADSPGTPAQDKDQLPDSVDVNAMAVTNSPPVPPGN